MVSSGQQHKNFGMNGILLCATGPQKYYSMCNTIIRDIRELMPEIPVAIYTDNENMVTDKDIVIEGHHNADKIFLSKIKACRQSPFQRTIFIDVDSRVLRPIDHLFSILDTHDFGLCFSDGRGILRDNNWVPGNTGLTFSSSTLLFHDSAEVNNFMLQWENEYSKGLKFPGKGDQEYLAYLVYHHSEVRYCVLPCEYRFNSDNPQFVSGSVKIITSMLSDIDPEGTILRTDLDLALNAQTGRRGFFINRMSGTYWRTAKKYLKKGIVINSIKRVQINSNLIQVFRFLKKMIKRHSVFAIAIYILIYEI